jgi:uncharacterized membrane protein
MALPWFTVIFFLPSFAWTLVFFKQINIIEGIALSFGLSITIVALSILALNVLLGARIASLNSLLVISFITTIPIASYYLKRLLGWPFPQPPPIISGIDIEGQDNLGQGILNFSSERRIEIV